jgi:hypothetical protein
VPVTDDNQLTALQDNILVAVRGYIYREGLNSVAQKDLSMST